MESKLFKKITPYVVVIDKEYSVTGKQISFNYSTIVSEVKIKVSELSSIRKLSNLDGIKNIREYYDSFFNSLNTNTELNYRLMLGSKMSKKYLMYLKTMINETVDMISTYHVKYLGLRKQCYQKLSPLFLEGKKLEIPVYDHSGVTGRTSIVKGFNYLTLKKEKRKSLRTNEHNKLLVEVDFKSCEPFFFMLSNNLDINNDDVYSWIANRYNIDISNREKTKRGILSMMYGANEYTISKIMSLNQRKVSEIKNDIGITDLKNKLTQEFEEKGFVNNYYGRPITSNNNLVNYWIQSSAVDFCSLSFLKFINTYNIQPCYLVHDSLTFKVTPEEYDTVKNLKYLSDPISKIKIPIEFNVLSL